jgi:hypothetical protein
VTILTGYPFSPTILWPDHPKAVSVLNMFSLELSYPHSWLCFKTIKLDGDPEARAVESAMALVRHGVSIPHRSEPGNRWFSNACSDSNLPGRKAQINSRCTTASDSQERSPRSPSFPYTTRTWSCLPELTHLCWTQPFTCYLFLIIPLTDAIIRLNFSWRMIK